MIINTLNIDIYQLFKYLCFQIHHSNDTIKPPQKTHLSNQDKN
jgi:hypothetical protein